MSKCQQTNQNLIFVHVFFAFYTISNIYRKQNFPGGGGGVVVFVELASEPVGGRSRATELPCFKINILFLNETYLSAVVGMYMYEENVCV